MRKIAVVLLALFVLVGPASAAGGKIAISPIVDVSRDQLSQNETPIAINPANPANTDHRRERLELQRRLRRQRVERRRQDLDADACRTASCPASRSSRTTRTSPAPAHTTPAATRPIAFSPDGKIAYYVCQAFDFTSPFDIALLMNRSYDGGLTWQQTGLTQIATFHRQRDDERVERPVRRPREPPRRPDERRRLRRPGRSSAARGTHSPVYVAASHDQGARGR